MTDADIIIQNYNRFLCFAVFDNDTKKMIYSKYNFKFDDYITDFSEYYLVTIADSNDKRSLFYDFLVRNNTDINKPFTVSEELKKYFDTSNSSTLNNIQNYFDNYGYIFYGFYFTSLSTYVNSNIIFTNEFDLKVYSDLEVSRISQFFFQDIEYSNTYSKYNFDFTLYADDFNVHGSKLAIFSDFIFRMIYLSKNAVGYIGFAEIPENFQKYFDLTVLGQSNLMEYLETSSVMSELDNVTKSVKNINFEKYYTDNNLISKGITKDTTKTYYYQYGQFQQDIITFNDEPDSEIKSIMKSICTIDSESDYGTAFLFNGTNDYEYVNGQKYIYLVTCYHIIANSLTKDTIFASVEYKNGENLRLQFRIIGYDVHSDICIGIYDEELDHNKAFYPSEIYNIVDNVQTLKIAGETKINIGEYVSVIGNLGKNQQKAYLEGKIIDPVYKGTFFGKYYLSSPSTILTDIEISKGISGAPIFIRDKLNKLLCVGMFNAKIGDSQQYSLGVSNYIFSRIIQNGIGYWHAASKIYLANKQYKLLQYYVQGIYQKKWLGIYYSYFNQQLTRESVNETNNFPINGGIVIEKFIIGFNMTTKKFITNHKDLYFQNVVKIDTPLLQTDLYAKFFSNSNTPIIITSIKFFNLLESVFQKFNLGNYNNQFSLDVLTYGLIQRGTIVNSPPYVGVKRLYNQITLGYYYFNGLEWIYTEENIGENTPNWYNTYDDAVFKYYQHKFDYPSFLTVYDNEFLYNENKTNKTTKNLMTCGSQNNFAYVSENSLMTCCSENSENSENSLMTCSNSNRFRRRATRSWNP